MGYTEQLKQLAADWHVAWNSRESARLAGLFTEQGTYYEPEMDAPVRGRGGIEPIAEQTWADWPQVAFEVVTLTVEPPRVVLEWRSTARHKSGRECNLEGVDVLIWDGDKIAEARVYYDVHSRMVALGQA